MTKPSKQRLTRAQQEVLRGAAKADQEGSVYRLWVGHRRSFDVLFRLGFVHPREFGVVTPTDAGRAWVEANPEADDARD